jgi:hypothetical protein
VEVVIEPEPEPDEQKALTLALARLLEGETLPPAYRSAWRRAGIDVNADPELPGYATARPRSSPGATRA